MIELRYVGEFDKRLQYRQGSDATTWVDMDTGKTVQKRQWGPWKDVPTVPADSDKLPDKE